MSAICNSASLLLLCTGHLGPPLDEAEQRERPPAEPEGSHKQLHTSSHKQLHTSRTQAAKRWQKAAQSRSTKRRSSQQAAKCAPKAQAPKQKAESRNAAKANGSHSLGHTLAPTNTLMLSQLWALLGHFRLADPKRVGWKMICVSEESECAAANWFENIQFNSIQSNPIQSAGSAQVAYVCACVSVCVAVWLRSLMSVGQKSRAVGVRVRQTRVRSSATRSALLGRKSTTMTTRRQLPSAPLRAPFGVSLHSAFYILRVNRHSPTRRPLTLAPRQPDVRDSQAQEAQCHASQRQLHTLANRPKGRSA